MTTVVAAWTRVIVDYARRRGVDTHAMLARRGLDEAMLARPEARVLARVDDELWGDVDRALGDPDLGVHVAESAVTAESFGIVGYLARASRTLAGAIEITRRFHRLIKDDTRARVVRDGGVTIIESPGARGAWPRPIAEAVLANYVAMGSAWSGHRIVPLEVRFQHARPVETGELERFFGVCPRFDQPDNAIVLAGDVLAAPLQTAETGLVALLENVATAQLSQLGVDARGGERSAVDRAFVDEVRVAVESLLEPSTDSARRAMLGRAKPAVSIDQVARQLAVSSRSLQRRLAEAGSTFREVVDRARLSRAAVLVQRGVPVAEVAERVGFSDERAFRRAYLRWTGHTPRRHLARSA